MSELPLRLRDAILALAHDSDDAPPHYYIARALLLALATRDRAHLLALAHDTLAPDSLKTFTERFDETGVTWPIPTGHDKPACIIQGCTTSSTSPSGSSSH